MSMDYQKPGYRTSSFNQCCFLLASISTCLGLSPYKGSSTFDAIDKTTLNRLNSNTAFERLPLCEINLLDRGFYNFTQLARASTEIEMFKLSETQSQLRCRLLRYTSKRAVACFDFLKTEITNLSEYEASHRNVSSKVEKKLHFAFIGDSRIRQHFYNFIKLVPDYDKKSNWKLNLKLDQRVGHTPSLNHGDVDVISKVLGLRVSFRWRPRINDELKKTILEFANPHPFEALHAVLMNPEIHHLIQQHGVTDIPSYERKLSEIKPFISKLSKVSQVIWLNHYPTVEFFGVSNAHNTDIYSEKIYFYNEAVRRSFKHYQDITIWDSSNPLAEEYIRGCLLNGRDSFDRKEYQNSYTDCEDYVHTGNVALFQATQILLNHFCNSKIK